jgi:hypothetical protein
LSAVVGSTVPSSSIWVPGDLEERSAHRWSRSRGLTYSSNR